MAIKRPGIYALRRTLPSWCFDERLDELLTFCKDCTIDEVIVKVDVEEFSHGIPTLPWLMKYMPMLTRARDALRAIGTEFSINPWVTVGHLDRGRDLRKIFPDFTWMVGHDGVKCNACACPLSQGWRDHTVKLWQLYASLEPNVIWIEDDIRTFNHLPARYGCFCELHMKAFSERVGEKVTREKLVAALLQDGEPHPWRAAWLDFLRDCIEDTCGVLADAVYEISPKTYLGLMSSGPDCHNIEGRSWKRLAEVLGRGKPIYSRPTLGGYTESSLDVLYYGAAEIKRTRFLCPPGTIEQTEVENIPSTGYSKSAAFTFLQIAISVSHGCNGATLNLFDHVGSPIAVEPNQGKMLAGERSFIEAIAETHSSDGVFAGVRVLHHERGSYVRRLTAGCDYRELAPYEYGWERALNALGFTTTYTASPVVAVDGQMIDAYSDDEIRDMLSGGVLVDLVAAEVLTRRGFGEMLGFDIDSTELIHARLPISAEELTDPAFAGRPHRYMTATLPTLINDARCGRITLHKGARAISRLVNPDNKPICDFVAVFENSLGGRVAVLPLDINVAMAPALLNHYRRAQVRAILDWLSRGRLPAAVEGGVYPLAYRMDFADRVMLGVFNLSHDDWPNVTWDICLEGKKAKSVQILGADGTWRASGAKSEKCEQVGSRLRITTAGELSFRRPLIMKLGL